MIDAVQIGPFRYKVEATVEAINRCRLQPDGTPNLVGWADHRELNIVVDPERPADRIAETFLHETLHAIIATLALSDFKGSDEHFVDVLSVGLLDTLRRNPDLTALLLDKKRISIPANLAEQVQTDPEAYKEIGTDGDG